MHSSWRGKSLVEQPKTLIVALSARALAVAAKRAGHAVMAVDRFGDADLSSVAEKSLTVGATPTGGFDPETLLAAAEILAPAASPACFGLVYGAGLEAQTELLERLCHGRRLYGNRAETVARLKDPAEFFGALDRLGIPHPPVCLAPPADGKEWLVKNIGGSGGIHIRSYDGARGDHAVYYQRPAAGRPIGVSFLADGRRAVIIGFNEQWQSGDRMQPFRFGGALQPAVIGPRLHGDIQPMLNAVVLEFGLVGLNNLDVMDDGDSCAVLEVNPRPGANLDVFDRAGDVSLFSCHIAACEGRLPGSWSSPSTTTAMAVVYADHSSRVPEDMDWPEWVVDRPATGAFIDEGAPVCTVLATGLTAADVRDLVAARVSLVKSKLGSSATPIGFNNGSQPLTGEAAHA
jgi:uncharacterized protein